MSQPPRQQLGEFSSIPPRRTALQQLALDEASIALRKKAIARFGSTWLKPPGISKTYQGKLDEEREQDEYNAEMREQAELIDTGEDDNATFANEDDLPVDGEADAEDAAEDADADEDDEAGDLDDEIPEAEEWSGTDDDEEVEERSSRIEASDAGSDNDDGNNEEDVDVSIGPNTSVGMHDVRPPPSSSSVATGLNSDGTTTSPSEALHRSPPPRFSHEVDDESRLMRQRQLRRQQQEQQQLLLAGEAGSRATGSPPRRTGWDAIRAIGRSRHGGRGVSPWRAIRRGSPAPVTPHAGGGGGDDEMETEE